MARNEPPVKAPGREIQKVRARFFRSASAAGVSATGMDGGVSDRPPGRVMVRRALRHLHRQIVHIGRNHHAAGGGKGGEFGIVAFGGHGASAIGRASTVRISPVTGSVSASALSAPGSQCGERGAPGIVLVAGEADGDGRGVGVGADGHFQVGAVALRGDAGRLFQVDAQTATCRCRKTLPAPPRRRPVAGSIDRLYQTGRSPAPPRR